MNKFFFYFLLPLFSYFQITWVEISFGDGSHLASVNPLHILFKWIATTHNTYGCSTYPTPFDLRPMEDRRPPAIKIPKSTLLLEQDASMTTTPTATTSTLPKNYDTRVDHARGKTCTDLINHPQNQGTCGSCYAFAAVATASIRACLAGHTLHKVGLSVQGTSCFNNN